MKTFTLCLSFCLFSTFLTGQSAYSGSAANSGFGDVGVVASDNNYQSAYFQNPALLARNNHRIDAFTNYARIGFRNLALSSGVMVNFNKNAIGIGVEHFSTDLFGSPYYSSTIIPLVYARNLYQTEKAGISVGANLNLSHIRYDYRNLLINPGTLDEYTFLTGGLGLNAYRTVNLSNHHSLRFDLGSSINNLGPDATSSNNTTFFVGNFYKIGGMIGWEWRISDAKKFNFNAAYQLGRVPQFSEFNIFQGTQHLGVEAKYGFASDMYWAIRGGVIWNQYPNGSQYGYTTFGGTLSIKGFYFDLAISENYNGTGNLQMGLGYQKALN